MINKKKFCLSKILKGGLPCPNPEIQWVVPHSDCLTSPCDSCTDECIELTMLEGCDANCVHVIIECPDCDSCAPQTHKVCFCNDNEDCGICETCSSAGVCVEKCEHCDETTGECGECSGGDCPGDLECIQGKCQCPPGSVKDGEICRYCTEDSECGPCRICTEDGKCVPKDCGSGVCDPLTGDCIGCTNSGHCGPNEICDDGDCVCAPGYVYDPVQGCIPQPPCESDSECGPCMKCTSEGCVPITCPDGKICVDGECVDLCNCDEPSCSKAGYGCQRISSDLCACLPCEDDKPCTEIPCNNGLDCPDGWGCKDGICVPCSTLNCGTGECDEVLGCECVGSRCMDSDNKCSGSCSGAEDCGPGCTCYRGRCVSCDNFACPDECGNIEGCGCQGDGTCGDDGKDCSDTFEINKRDDNCQIEGVLVSEKSCQCPRVSMNAKVHSVSSPTQFVRGINFLIELRKGDADEEGILNLPLLRDTGIANEFPLSGSLRVRVIEKIKSSNYATPVSEDVVYSQVLSLAAVDTVETGMLNFNPPGSTKINPNTGSTERVGEVEIQFVLDRKSLNFENSCSYSEEDVVLSYRITANGGNGFIKYSDIASGTSPFIKYEVLQSASDRNPVFFWYKSGDNGVETMFRSSYPEETSPGVFKDGWLGVDEGVEIGKFYRLEADCSCDGTVFYTCPESGAISKLRYCNPKNLAHKLVFDLKDCNKTISFNPASNTFPVCEANSRGGQVYELYLNGRVAARFTAANGQVVFSGDYTASSSITEIEVRLAGHNCEKCYEVRELTPAEITVESVGYDCDGDALEYSISGGSGNYSLTVDGIPTSLSGPISLKTGDHILVFLDNATGCTVEQAVSVNCCADLQVNVPNVQSCTGSEITVTFEVDNGIPPYQYIIANELNPIKEDVTNESEVTVVIPPQPSGLHAVKVVDGRGCEAIGSFNISASANPSVSVGDTEFCEGVSTKEFTATATGGTSFSYEIRQGGSVIKSGTTSGQINETLNTGGNNSYTLVVQNQTGCQTITNFALVSKSCPDPEVTMNTTEACQGRPLTLRGLITGGNPPYEWSISQSGVPIGDGEGAEVFLETGTSYTSTQGTVNFTIEVSDANSKTITENFSITVVDFASSECVDCGEPVDLSIDFLAGSEASELGENIILTAVGGDGTVSKYVWLHDGEQVGTGISFIPPQSTVGEEYYTLRYGEDPCYQFTDPQRVIISEEECDCTPTIKVISGIEGLNGKSVTTFNQNSGEDVCVGTGKNIKVEAVFSSGCSGSQSYTWRVRRRVGFITIQDYTVDDVSTLTYEAKSTGNLTIDLTSTDQANCIRTATQLKSKLVTCQTPDPFYTNLSGTANVCKVDAGTYKTSVVVHANKIYNYLNCDHTCYDTFPFTYKVKKGTEVLASGQKNGGWTSSGSNSVPVTLDLSKYNGIITLTVEVTRTDTNETAKGTDNVNVRSATDPMCDICQGRTVTATIAQGSQVEMYEGSTVTLSGSGSSPAGISSYSWRRKSDNAQLSTSTTFSASPTTTTDYILTVRDSDGCEASATIKVVVNEPCPPMNLTLTTPGPKCPGTNVDVFYGVPQGITAQLSIEGQNTINVTGSGSTSFTMSQEDVALSITATDSCGETKTVNRTVKKDTGCTCKLSSLAISGPTTLCPGKTGTYSIVPFGDSSAYTISWYDDNDVLLGTGDSIVYEQPTSGLNTLSDSGVNAKLYTDLKVVATNTGDSCDEVESTLRIFSNCGGSIVGFGYAGPNLYLSTVYWCVESAGCSVSNIASIDKFIVTVGSSSPVDLTSQASIVAHTGDNCNGITRFSSGVHIFPESSSAGRPPITIEVQWTSDEGFVCDRTYTHYYS